MLSCITRGLISPVDTKTTSECNSSVIKVRLTVYIAFSIKHVYGSLKVFWPAVYRMVELARDLQLRTFLRSLGLLALL